MPLFTRKSAKPSRGSRPTDSSTLLRGDQPAPAAVASPPDAVTEVKHPLAYHALAALRSKHTAPREFRLASNQLLLLLAHEATRELPTMEQAVETSSQVHTAQVLARPLVFLSLTRHGLGLAHQLVDQIPGALVGSISLDSAGKGSRIDPRLHITNAPPLGDAQVVIFDPVVSTGVSASLALALVRRFGATNPALVSFVISTRGLERVQASAPGVKIWTVAIDTEWDAKRGPVPGLEDFAARLYG